MIFALQSEKSASVIHRDQFVNKVKDQMKVRDHQILSISPSTEVPPSYGYWKFSDTSLYALFCLNFYDFSVFRIWVQINLDLMDS